MIDKIDSVVNAIGGFLYQPYIVPLFLIVAGLYFTIRTGLIQFRLFGESIHVVAEKPKEKGSISSFGALMVSTASRVGTGNIVGVSTAICLGGFGAVFWMWVVALLGGASAFIESALAQVYKKKGRQGRLRWRPVVLHGAGAAPALARRHFRRRAHPDLCGRLQHARVLQPAGRLRLALASTPRAARRTSSARSWRCCSPRACSAAASA